MPYINKTDRERIDEESIRRLSIDISNIPSGKIKGALNYVVSRLALQVYGTESYTSISDGIAALQDAADEIKRRTLSKVEDKAIGKNGDLPEYVQ